jgi:hypothetical protein
MTNDWPVNENNQQNQYKELYSPPFNQISSFLGLVLAALDCFTNQKKKAPSSFSSCRDRGMYPAYISLEMVDEMFSNR